VEVSGVMVLKVALVESPSLVVALVGFAVVHVCSEFEPVLTSPGHFWQHMGAALGQLFSLPDAGVSERLIIVTDGGHDHPEELLKKCGKYIECTPDELENQLDWLNEHEQARLPKEISGNLRWSPAFRRNQCSQNGLG